MANLKAFASKLLKKDKIILLLLVGVLLLIIRLPVKSSRKENTTEKQTIAIDYTKELEDKLSETLSMSTTAGKTKVVITLQNDGSKDLYPINEDVVYEKIDGDSKPYVVSGNSPSVRGVMILCENADNANAVNEVTEAVSALLGITVNRIKVLKMEV